MLENVLSHLKNWFIVPGGVHSGTFSIKNNALSLDFLQNGQYYRICGSIFNDGLHRYGDTTDILTNEEFTGAIWALAIPKRVIELSQMVTEWEAKNGEAAQSPYSSESFGGYSYSKATDTKTGRPVTWQTAFSAELKEYRKARETGIVEPQRPLHPTLETVTPPMRRGIYEPY